MAPFGPPFSPFALPFVIGLFGIFLGKTALLAPFSRCLVRFGLSELHRKLQAAYKADDTAFIRDVVKQITASKETETATTTADQDEADYRKILEDMLAEMEGRTGQPNDGTVKAPGDGLPHRPQGTDR